MSDSTVSVKATGWLNIAIWVAQVVLALGFGLAGFTKVTATIAEMAPSMGAWVTTLPEWLVRFIGVAELAGAVGVILPAVTRILPGLTPLAALGFAAIQVMAVPTHLMLGEYYAWPINLTLLTLSLFVVWGRWKKVPVTPR